MQFRDTGRDIQILRVRTGKGAAGRPEAVGKLSKKKPIVGQVIRDKLSPEEVAEVEVYVEGLFALQAAEREYVLNTLPNALAVAEEWFSKASDDDARVRAEALAKPISKLRRQLNRFK